MITEFGENLHVLLVPKIKEDWESFASWYSINKNIPYASCSLIYVIEKDVTPFQLFQWGKRINIHVSGISNKKNNLLNIIRSLIQSKKKNVLITPSFNMVLKPLTKDILDIFNQEPQFIWNNDSFSFCSLSINQLINLYNQLTLKGSCDIKNQSISQEAKDSIDLNSLVNYKKGCGKWIHTMKGCPFSSAGGLLEEVMTVNEQEIFNLWEKMVPLYSSIN